MRKLKTLGIRIIALCAMGCGSATAWADEPAGGATEIPIDDACYGLDQNGEWFRLFADFSAAFSANDYDKALSYTGELEKICSRSPVLNYSIANTYLQKGDLVVAKGYIESATSNLKEFSASDEMTQKIWFMRYELEHYGNYVSKAEAEARENALQGELSKERENRHESFVAEKSRYAAIMWTGTGVGVVGMASLIAGGVLAAVYDDLTGSFDLGAVKNGNATQITNTNLHQIKTAYAFIGVGIAATIAGAVMAGLGGYHYKRITDGENERAMSFSLSPRSVQFGVIF